MMPDFSENYSFVLQDATQSFHWNNSQATIHPFVAYYMKFGELHCNEGVRKEYFQSESTKSSADWIMVSRVDLSTETHCLYTTLSIRRSSIRELKRCFSPDIPGHEVVVDCR